MKFIFGLCKPFFQGQRSAKVQRMFSTYSKVHSSISNPMLQLVPVSFAQACAFIKEYHRHHKPSQGHKFSLAVAEGDKIVGVITVGRPVARFRDDGWTLEVNRSCTNGTKNANSMLYAAAWRVARNLGYRRLITYTLPEESGSSLKAAGWELVGEAGGGAWNRKSRPRVDKHPLQRKLLWQAVGNKCYQRRQRNYIESVKLIAT